MKKISLLLLLLAGVTGLHAEVLFDAEKRPGFTRPEPDQALTSPKTFVEEDRVKSKAPGWQPNGIRVYDTTGSANRQRICTDGNSGAIICWDERYRGGFSDSDYDVYAQRVDSGGNLRWQSQGVPICTLSASNSNYTAMVADGYGGAIIAWEDNRSGLPKVYAQRVDSMGNKLWTENGVNVCSYHSGYVDLCSDGHGGAIIAYMDGRNSAVTSDDIYAQRIDSVGNPAWMVDGVPVCTADSIQFWPHIVMDGLDGAVITWEEDLRNGNYDIYAQRINCLGNTVWLTNGLEISVKPNRQDKSDLCRNNYGGAIIKWNDYTDSNTYAQSLDSLGNKKWLNNGVNLNGGYSGYINSILFWGGVTNVYNAQYIDSLGNVKWGDGILLHGDSTGSGFGANSDMFNNLFVVWDINISLNYYDQFVQKVDTNGNLMWGFGGVSICTLKILNESYPKVVNDCLGGAICTWGRIYAQRIYADGTPGGVAGEPGESSIFKVSGLKVFPNPVEYYANIRYTMSQSGKVRIVVYNIAGQLVRILEDGDAQAGDYIVKWDGCDNNGKSVSSGMLFCLHRKIVIL